MKESIGMTFLINIVLIFIVFIFAFLAGTISYNKAFKVNSRIVSALEKYEGYNALSKAEIDSVLGQIGYIQGSNKKCPKKSGANAMMIGNERYKYCIYYFNDGNNYFRYGVTSYIHIDIPIIGDLLSIPIYATTRSIYNFK